MKPPDGVERRTGAGAFVDSARRSPGLALATTAPAAYVSDDRSQHGADCPTVLVGCAGWALPRIARERFPSEGSLLQCYAAKFPVVEVNSSFYRAHRPSTYARWTTGVPATFRFAVKVPKAITHAARLTDAVPMLHAFMAQVSALGSHLGCLLVQLPPSLAFDSNVADAFFVAMREQYAGPIALEPRHPTWFVSGAERLLVAFRVSRVAADPAISPSAGEPGGWQDFVYYRLHGSPRVYGLTLRSVVRCKPGRKTSGARTRAKNHLLHLRQYGTRPCDLECARLACEREIPVMKAGPGVARTSHAGWLESHPVRARWLAASRPPAARSRAIGEDAQATTAITRDSFSSMRLPRRPGLSALSLRPASPRL